MKVQKSKLTGILDALRPGLSSKDIIELSDSITFTGSHMITYNDVIAVRFPFDTDFEGAVKEERLTKHITKAVSDKEGNIRLSIKESNLIITSGIKGKTEAGIPILEGSKIDLSELDDDDLDWKKLSKDFSDGLRLSIFSAGTDQTKPILTCLHIKGNIIESSNGYRGFRYKMEKKVKHEFLLPATSAPAILDHVVKSYAISKNWVHFKTKEGVIVSCRMYADIEYPDTSFLYEVKGVEVLFPDEMIDVISRAVDFVGSDEESKYLTVKIEKKKISISSESIHGWFHEPIKVRSKHETEFVVNPIFMKDILKTTTTGILNKDKGFLKFESDKWEHVINIVVE